MTHVKAKQKCPLDISRLGRCKKDSGLLRHPDDQPSIGLILCKTNGRFIAEYALRDINKPTGISEYRSPKVFPTS